MPRGAALKIQGASTQTRWILAPNDITLGTPKVPNFSMQTTNGNFHFDDNHQASPVVYEGYDAYDGSGYDSPASSRGDSAQWKHATAVNGGHYDDYPSYNHAIDDRANHQISLNTRVLSPSQDAVGRHFLYETALLDTQHFEILDINEVDDLKKEYERLNSRIDAANRKLVLESKVKDAAQNIQRLYSSKDARPDTPQSPESPRKTRGRNGSNLSQNGQSLEQAKEEVAQSIKKVDELNETIKSLLERRALVERKLLRHTAAVLAEQTAQASAAPGKQPNGQFDFDDDSALYAPNEFDGIRDILHGKPAGQGGDTRKLQEQHEQQLASMQDRLEHLNNQLRGVISEAAQSRGQPIEPEIDFHQSEDPVANVEHSLGKLESSLHLLEDERKANNSFFAKASIEEQLEGLNNQLHNTLLISTDEELSEEIQPPPIVNGHGYQHQLQYLEQSLLALEKLLQRVEQNRGPSRSLDPKNAASAQKAAEYENVLAGLWDLIQADAGPTPRGSTATTPRGSTDSPRSPGGGLKQDFSLQAFSSRVQHMFDVANSAKEQQDILRRQIQQQRDLNGKSDMEKDREIDEWQKRHEELQQSHSELQDELAKSMVNHRQSEREATESRAEMARVISEFDQLQRVVEARTQDRDKLSQQLQVHHAELDAKLQERDEIAQDFEQKHDNLQKDVEKLESEIVRLTTELTIAKADLEGAYGTRAQRQKEAGASQEEIEAVSTELENLKEQHKNLEAELQEMTQEFQEMTRESLELEKERGQLEGLIDGLRDRCDSLEGQLADERVRWLGVKSPGGTPPGDGTNGREAMSVMVLRQEFKRMMREARAEGIRHIRVSFEDISSTQERD